MKYKPEDYSIIESGFYGLAHVVEDIDHYSEKLVKCRKSHVCMNCEKEIKPGEYAVTEKGFLRREFVRSYICTECLDEWLDKVNSK